MTNKILFGLDAIVCFFGVFWAGIILFRFNFSGFVLVDWLVLFSLIVVLLYPLIRTAVEVFFENFGIEWKGFGSDWKKEAKKK